MTWLRTYRYEAIKIEEFFLMAMILSLSLVRARALNSLANHWGPLVNHYKNGINILGDFFSSPFENRRSMKFYKICCEMAVVRAQRSSGQVRPGRKHRKRGTRGKVKFCFKLQESKYINKATELFQELKS